MVEPRITEAKIRTTGNKAADVEEETPVSADRRGEIVGHAPLDVVATGDDMDRPVQHIEDCFDRAIMADLFVVVIVTAHKHDIRERKTSGLDPGDDGQKVMRVALAVRRDVKVADMSIDEKTPAQVASAP